VTQDDLPAPGSDGASARLDGSLPVVAMDGPSGTGKSTVSRRLALRLGLRYLDTGAMYRAATLAVLNRDIDLADDAALAEAVAQSQIEISTDPHKAAVALDGIPVDAEIRSGPVTAAVSAVSAVPAIRALLVRAQRELIGAGGIVVEGRDIGSVVWPSAVPKIYLTASATVRAQRRAGELGSGSDLAAVAAVADDIERRDRLDSTRAHSPLAMVEDAIEFDTTKLDIDEVVNRLVDIVRASVGRA
jgi:CMP/dCMP kinase